MNMMWITLLYASGIAGAVYLGINGHFWLAFWIIVGLSGISYRERREDK